MDHLCELPNDAARRKALNALPPTLHATYERILQRVNKSNIDVQQLVQRSLRWLVCSKGQLTSLALCEAISIETGDTQLHQDRISDENEILRWCSSLVRRSALGNCLELAHFTVKEFLMTTMDLRGRDFSVYHFGPEKDDVEMAEKCLTYLLFQHEENDKSFNREFMQENRGTCNFHQYAVFYWSEHARKNLSKPTISFLTQKLLHPSKPYTFISWARRRIKHSQPHRGCENIDFSTTSPLHFACILRLPECCEWLLHKGCRINQPSPFGTPFRCAVLGYSVLAVQQPLDWSMEPPAAELEGPRQATMAFLIDSGVDVHSSSNGEPSPIFHALSENDRVSCVKLLCKGALIDSKSAELLSRSDTCDLACEIWRGVDSTSLRPKDRAILLNAALRSENFCNDGPLAPFVQNSQSVLKPFLAAAEYGQLAIVEQIVQDQEFDINAAGHSDQRSALHLAASNDHIDIVKFLIVRGADSTLPDSRGRTPLHTSVDKPGGCRCLGFLLGPNTNVNIRDIDGLTVWHLAALEGNVHALRILRSFTAGGQSQLHLKAKDGRTILHCAAQSPSKETLVFLMDYCNQSMVHDTTLDGCTALHYAAKTNSLDAVQYLVDQDFGIHAVMNNGSNTLHCAVDHDSKATYEVVELLLQKGVDPCKIRRDGMTPIHLLLSTHQPREFVEMCRPDASNEPDSLLGVLAKYATSLDITYGAGFSALHQVCQLRENDHHFWSSHALKTLLQNGADPTLQDNEGKTALMYLVETWKALTARHYRIATAGTMIEIFLESTTDEQFLSKVYADPQIFSLALESGNEVLAYKLLECPSSVDATAYGISVLSYLEAACKYGCSRQLLEELVNRSKVDSSAAGLRSGLLVSACRSTHTVDKAIVIDLLHLGFDPNDRTVDGKTAMMLAAQGGHAAVVTSLVDHGADLFATDNNGWSVVHYALQSDSEELLHLLRKIITDWNATITADFGLYPGQCSRHATALHIAACHDSCALEFLLKNDLISNVNHVTDLQETALVIALSRNIRKNVDQLLEVNSDTTICPYQADSLLHIAVRNGFMGIVEDFASRGADLLLRDTSGLTPELVARKYGHQDIAKFLKGKSAGGKNEPGRRVTTFSPLTSN